MHGLYNELINEEIVSSSVFIEFATKRKERPSKARYLVNNYVYRLLLILFRYFNCHSFLYIGGKTTRWQKRLLGKDRSVAIKLPIAYHLFRYFVLVPNKEYLLTSQNTFLNIFEAHSQQDLNIFTTKTRTSCDLFPATMRHYSIFTTPL